MAREMNAHEKASLKEFNSIIKGNSPIPKYVLTVDINIGYENIWRGDDLSEGIHYRNIAIKHWGKDAVALLPAE